MAVTRVSGYTRRGSHGQSERVSSYVRDGGIHQLVRDAVTSGKSVDNRTARFLLSQVDAHGATKTPQDRTRLTTIRNAAASGKSMDNNVSRYLLKLIDQGKQEGANWKMRPNATQLYGDPEKGITFPGDIETHENNTGYVVGNPKLGYSATWSPKGVDKRHDLGRFGSVDEAKKAVEAHHQSEEGPGDEVGPSDNERSETKPSALDRIKGFVRHQTGTDLPKSQHGAGRQHANVYESIRQGVGAGTETRPNANGRKVSAQLSDVEIARRAKKDPELLTEEQLQRAVDLRVLHPKVAGPIIAKRRKWKKGWSGTMQHVAPMSAVDRLQEKVELSVDTARVSTVHSPLGKKDLWNTKGLQLPAYIQNIAKAIMRDGKMDESHAIATAVSRCKVWAAGGGGVSPEVQAAAAKAIAEWTAAKAKAHATPNKH